MNMLNPQLALYDEELSEIREVADRLHQDSRARTILIVDKNGQLIAASGVDADLDTTSFSSLLAGNVAATDGIARLIEEKEFTGQFHEGKETSVHMTIVARRIILAILFDKNTTQGLVRLRVKKASEALTDIFERIAAKPKGEQEDVFKEITDDDIDALFGP